MNTRDKHVQIKPLPPELLDTYSRGVWMGWCNMGDKEVAREAATKGTHIKLAMKFLSARNDLDIVEAEKLFKDEVHSWVLHLLTRNQVFKASHILKNLNEDPAAEMLSIFFDASCKELRENVGSHLLKCNKLDEAAVETWALLKCIENHYDVLFSLKEQYILINVNLIAQQTTEWKNQMGTQLFFRSFDFSLEPFVTSLCSWDHLLKTNLNLVKLWINVHFGQTLCIEICDINVDIQTIDKLNSLFLNLAITREMVDAVTDNDASPDESGRNLVLNELSRYGVFNSSDNENIIAMVRRFVNTNNVENISQVISRKCATVDLMKFYDLLVKYCVEHKYYSVLNLCTKDLIFSSDFIEQVNSPWLNVIVDIRNFVQNLSDESALRNNVFEVAQLLSATTSNDMGQYFSSFPVVLLALVLFTKDIRIYDVLSNKVSIKIRDFQINGSVLLDCVRNLSVFMLIYNKLEGSFALNAPTCYDLLEKHGNVKVKETFSFRFGSSPMPHFNQAKLVQKYGYNKRVNFLYYLKQCKAGYACKMFILNHFETHSQVQQNFLEFATLKTYKLALKNFRSQEGTTSCVAFLEMIGENSDVLRIYLKVASTIYNANILNETEIIKLLNDVLVNCQEILNFLERALIQEISLSVSSDGQEVIDAVKTYDVAVKFSAIHNLKPPELFPKHCAKLDLWLPFLIYVQIYKYPIDLTRRLVQHFQSSTLIEHLSHCVSHDVPADEPKNLLMGERDSRKYFLSRIGVRKSLESNTSASEVSLASHSSYGSMSSSCSSDFLESDTLDYKTDLLQVLIRCHNSTDPPKALLHAARYYKNAFLAVLATSYEPDSLINNWATWLAVSCSISEPCSIYEGLVLTSEAALKLLKCILEKSFFKTLHNSFCIFLPDNPLKLIIEFLNDCVCLNFDEEVASQKLFLFHKQLKYSRRNSYVTEAANDLSYFNNKLWIQNTTMFLVALTLKYGFKSRYDQIHFLDVLTFIDISKYFFIESPDFTGVLEILRYASDNSCDINLDLSVIYDKNMYINEVTRCINELAAKKLYEIALNIAKIASIPPDDVIIQEVKDEFASRNLSKEKFWPKWDKVFREIQISPSTAVKFYVECAEKIDGNLEKYEVLKIAYSWAQKHRLSTIIEVEKTMWLAFFYLDDRLKKFESTSTDCEVVLYSELLKELDDVSAGTVVLNENETNNWHKTVEDLLNVGDVYTALRLEKIFGYRNTDLEILKVCLSLVEEILLPHQLNAEQRLLLTKRANVRGFSTRKRKYISRLSSSSVSHSPTAQFYMHINDNVVMPIHDTLALLEILVENVKNGAQLALKILMMYRISVNVEKKYHDVLKCKDPIEMIKSALENDCDNKLQVISDLLLVYKLSREEVADFICEEIIKAATEYSKSRIDICFLWDMNADVDFSLVLQMMPDNCTILGLKLYSYASALYKSQTEGAAEFKLNEIILIIELLIRSHDCFTADCNMEGISIVLKKCQVIISLLIMLKNWKLIVRLLTGIARYSEMNYVFQILRVNGQFELLLRKGSRKDAGLKVALLEYLKKYCPDDLELYKIVALHFFLFSEIAVLWEQESETIIRRLIALSKLEMQNDKLNLEIEPFVLLMNSDDTKRSLNKVMSNYRHASEYHLYGEKLAKGMNAAKQAQLLALQLSLLKDLSNNGKCVCLLNLTNVQITSLLTSKLSFPQALILVEAYKYQADWAFVLFEQYLVHNNFDYLSNFMSSFPLSENLAHDISRRFLSSKYITATMVQNMKDVLNKLPSIHTKYRIASELGFSDLIEDLLVGHQLAYLKDTVWKKGYKSSKD